MASAKQDIVGGSEHEDLALHVDGLIGPASVESVKLVKLARWKKTTEWLNCPFTFPRLSTHVCSMQTILSLMARAFEESRHRNTCSIIPWLLPATSPAASAVRRIAKLLCNEGDPHWHPVSHAWTDDIRNILAVTCYILLGGLVHRCIHSFDELPWVLGRLGVGAQTTDFEQEEAVSALLNARRCCLSPTDGLTAPIAQIMPTQEVIDLPSSRAMIADIFSMSVSTNIIVEDRHARLCECSESFTHLLVVGLSCTLHPLVHRILL